MTKHLKQMISIIAVAATLTTAMAPTAASAAGYTRCSYCGSNSYIPGKSALTVQISKESGKYYLYDQTRNIKFVTATSKVGHAMPNANNLLSFTSLDDITKQEMATLYNVENVFDWFKNLGCTCLGSGNGGTLYVSLTDAGKSNGTVVYDYSWLTFGQKGTGSIIKPMAVDQDVVGHEMTHIILQKKLGWSNEAALSNETKALMEGYCDILGELADKDADWKIGYDSYTGNLSLCDISNPRATVSYNQDNPRNMYLTNNFYTRYDMFQNKEFENVQNDRSLSQRAATILSHAAYLMNQQGVSREDLAHIWYNSIDCFSMFCNPSKATFADCRKAVTSAANSYLYKYSTAKRMDILEIIENAFDSAFIFTETNDAIVYPLTYTSLLQSQGANATHMSSFVRAEQQKFPNGKFWASDDNNTYASSNPYNLDNGLSVCPTFFRGFDRSFHFENEERYTQCAGFAKKLQRDYFGSTKCLQILKTSTAYEPRIGDHMRVEPQPYSCPSGHSIFVTAVNGNTITYADCNANGDNMILWNRKATYSKTDQSVVLADGSKYYYKWVERPMMLGDANGDSYVNAQDVTTLQTLVTKGRYYSSTADTDLTYRNFAADVNKDGSISQADVDLLKSQISNRNGINLEYIK